MAESVDAKEQQRRERTGDDWFFRKEPYLLEVTSPALPQGSLVFALPLGLEGYSVRRTLRQTVTPTLGAVVAEEQGLLWLDVQVSGTFGLEPKKGYDTSIQPNPAVTDALSGPLWTKRLLQNVFERYAELKSDPEYSHQTRMIWHDMKMDEHWVIVPQDVSVDRSSGRRLQYPFSFTFKGIEQAGKPSSTPPLANVTREVRGVKATKNAVGALDRLAAVLRDAARIVSEIRTKVQGWDQVIDDVTTAVDAARAVVAAGKSFLDIPVMFFRSLTGLMEAGVLLMEDITDIPFDVVHAYKSCIDELDMIVALGKRAGSDITSKVTKLTKSEAGAARDPDEVLTAAELAGAPADMAAFAAVSTRSTDKALVKAGALPDGRVYGQYSAFRYAEVKSTDTLESIAAEALGDGARWYELAVLNDLKYPYITAAGLEGTVAPGDSVLVPVVGSVNQGSARVPTSTPDSVLFGTNLALTVQMSSSGRPLVGLAIDKRTNRDCKLVTGLGNLQQALQMMIWTSRGAISFLPGYGLKDPVGYGSTQASATIMRLNLRELLLSDSRVDQVSNMRFVAEGDQYIVDVDVVPIGQRTARTLSAFLK